MKNETFMSNLDSEELVQANDVSVAEEEVDLEKKEIEVMQKIEDNLEEMLLRGDSLVFFSAIEMFKERDLLMSSERLKTAAKSALNNCFLVNQFDMPLIMKLKDFSGIQDDDFLSRIESSLIRKAASSGFDQMYESLKEYGFEGILKSKTLIEDGFNKVDYLIRSKDYGEAIRVKENLELEDGAFSILIKSYAKKMISNCNKEVIWLQDVFDIEKQFFEDLDVKEGLRSIFYSLLIDGDYALMIKMKDQGLVEDDIFEDKIAKKGMEGVVEVMLKEGNINGVAQMQKRFPQAGGFVETERGREALNNGFINALRNENIDLAFNIVDLFEINEEVLASENVQRLLEPLMRRIIFNNKGFEEFEKYASKLRFSEDVKENIVLSFLLYNLNNGNIRGAVDVKKFFKLDDELVKDVIQYEIFHALDESDEEFSYDLYVINKEFKLGKDWFSMPEVKGKIMKYAGSILRDSHYEAFQKICEVAMIPAEDFNKLLISYINARLENYSDESHGEILDLIHSFKGAKDLLKDPSLKKGAGNAFIAALKDDLQYDFMFGGELYTALEIEEMFGVDREFIKTVAKSFILDIVYDGSAPFNMLKIKETFLKDVTSRELMEMDSDVGSFFLDIKKEDEDFYNEIENVPNLAIACLSYFKNGSLMDMLNDFPFMKNVVQENRFGVKFFLKFEEFDDLSKEKISLLRGWREEILKENPGIDTESVDFRELIQEKAKNYGNNFETLIRLDGLINVERWLNYNREEDFVLKNSDEKDFSEIVQVSLEDVNENILNYSKIVRNGLSDYKSQLDQYMIYPVECEKIEQMIARIEEEMISESAKEEKDLRKLNGMQKGLEAKKEELKRVKKQTISAWEKIFFIEERIKKLKSANNELMELERREDYSKEGKNNLARAKENLKRVFYDVREESSKLRENLKSCLEEVVKNELEGKEVEKVINELDNKLNDVFLNVSNHISDLNKTFSRKQEKSDFSKNNMTIKVWNRDPVKDIYQGNYSGCCISIESGCGGDMSRSAIADYLIEYGIQVVNIVDKNRNMPVVSAWCWIGVDEDDKPYFVVDNVEANTDYTKHYGSLFEDKLTEYIKQYAQDIGLPESQTVKGIVHNDVELFLKDLDINIAFSGVPDREEGYYLESEDFFEDEIE